MNGKKITWIIIAAGIFLPLFYTQVYRKHIDPEKSIEALRMEDGKYVYVVEEYGKFPREKHTIKKIGEATGKTLWKKKMHTGHHLNHQNHRDLPALFTDKANLYYYIHDMDEMYYLLGYDKVTGEKTLAVKLKDHIPGDRIQPALYVPYLQLEDRILFFSTYFFRVEHPEYTLTVTSVKKDGSEITNTRLETDEQFIAFPQGAEDTKEKYITMYDMPETLILSKTDPADQRLITKNYNPGLQRDGYYYYIDRTGALIRRDLETDREKRLFHRPELQHAFFTMYDEDGFIIQNDSNKDEYFAKYSYGGKKEWVYRLPEGWYFGDLFAWEHTHSSAAKSVYYYLKHDYLPIIMTKRPKTEDSPDIMAVAMLNIKTGKELWKETLEHTSIHDLNSATVFIDKGRFYILFKNTILQIDADTGAIIKSIRLYLNDSGDEYDLIQKYHIKMHDFNEGKLILNSLRSGFAVIDLEQDTFRFFGKKGRNAKLTLDVKKEAPFFD